MSISMALGNGAAGIESFPPPISTNALGGNAATAFPATICTDEGGKRESRTLAAGAVEFGSVIAALGGRNGVATCAQAPASIADEAVVTVDVRTEATSNATAPINPALLEEDALDEAPVVSEVVGKWIEPVELTKPVNPALGSLDEALVVKGKSTRIMSI